MSHGHFHENIFNNQIKFGVSTFDWVGLQTWNIPFQLGQFTNNYLRRIFWLQNFEAACFSFSYCDVSKQDQFSTIKGFFSGWFYQKIKYILFYEPF